MRVLVLSGKVYVESSSKHGRSQKNVSRVLDTLARVCFSRISSRDIAQP